MVYNTSTILVVNLGVCFFHIFRVDTSRSKVKDEELGYHKISNTLIPMPLN